MVRYWGVRMLAITAIGAVFASARNILASKVSQSFGADLRHAAINYARIIKKTVAFVKRKFYKKPTQRRHTRPGRFRTMCSLFLVTNYSTKIYCVLFFQQ